MGFSLIQPTSIATTKNMKPKRKLPLPEAREYKVLLDASMFSHWKRGLFQFEAELRQLLHEDHPGGPFQFELHKQRAVEFLDSPQHNVRELGFLLRLRSSLRDPQKNELTLKRRSPDFCVALQRGRFCCKQIPAQSKLEEDIVPPFVSRFSKSSTVAWNQSPPETLEQASRIFPILKSAALGESPLLRVQGLLMRESVWTGPTVTIEDFPSTLALIVWRPCLDDDGKNHRICAVELSFRVPLSVELVGSRAAHRYGELYQRIQKLDWINAHAKTKTAYLYGE